MYSLKTFDNVALYVMVFIYIQISDFSFSWKKISLIWWLILRKLDVSPFEVYNKYNGTYI